MNSITSNTVYKALCNIIDPENHPLEKHETIVVVCMNKSRDEMFLQAMSLVHKAMVTGMTATMRRQISAEDLSEEESEDTRVRGDT